MEQQPHMRQVTENVEEPWCFSRALLGLLEMVGSLKNGVGKKTYKMACTTEREGGWRHGNKMDKGCNHLLIQK